MQLLQISNYDKVEFVFSLHTRLLDCNRKEVLVSILLACYEMMAYWISSSVKTTSAQATIETIRRAFAEDIMTPLNSFHYTTKNWIEGRLG